MLSQVLVATSTENFESPALSPRGALDAGQPTRGTTLGSHLLLEIARQLTQMSWRMKSMVFSDTFSENLSDEESEPLLEIARHAIRSGTTKNFSHFLFDSGIIINSVEIITPERVTVTVRRAGRIEAPRGDVVYLNRILNDALQRAWRVTSGSQ